MRNILNIVNVKTSTETYGSFSDNLDSDVFFIKHEYPLSIYQLVRVEGVVFEIVGISINSNGFEYKIRLCYNVDVIDDVL